MLLVVTLHHANYWIKVKVLGALYPRPELLIKHHIKYFAAISAASKCDENADESDRVID